MRLFGIKSAPETQPGGACEADRRLAEAAGLGDMAARQAIVVRVLDRVRRLAAFLAGPTWEPDDLAQCALVAVLRSASRFRGECPLEHWVDRITVNTALRGVARRQRRERLFVGYETDGEAAALPDELVENARMRERLARALGELDPLRRTALVLHHVQGHGVGEIAAMTGASPNTVKDRLRVGRQQLRERLVADDQLAAWLAEKRT